MANRVGLRVARSGAVLGTAVECADSPWARMCGLLGRASLAEGGGMRFEPASSLHMMFMRFAIDLVYVDREERVVKLVSDFAPWRFSAARGARTAYELPAGVIAGCDIEVGDTLILEPVAEGAAA
ncbi:MAG: DUF192 domain-containing protein [Chloroflexi bacterium]|nr:DUF192 domain-containing protein [Chloroflexota bacterium]MDA1147724.1 DUF192 domain-containing protein [Chloroflexota bacterium]